jgi:hypothetical protein
MVLTLKLATTLQKNPLLKKNFELKTTRPLSVNELKEQKLLDRLDELRK